MEPTTLPPTPVNAQPALGFLQGIFSSIFSLGFLGFLYIVAGILVVGLITLILFLLVRMYEIKQEDESKKKPTVTLGSIPSGAQNSAQSGVGDAMVPVENKTWKGIRERLLSSNTSDWKLAIIEGDIYMDKVLDDKGFHGDTTGDKLKQITPDKLPSIQIAWEVHLIRNRIAHQGAAFVLTMPEARRLLSSYEIIFTDLGVI